MNAKKNKLRLDMETIDEADLLTLVIMLPENGGSTKIGEIKFNIVDLFVNKRKTYLIGDDVAIELKIKYELLNNLTPKQNVLNTTADSSLQLSHEQDESISVDHDSSLSLSRAAKKGLLLKK